MDVNVEQKSGERPPGRLFRIGKKMRHKVSAVVARSSRVGDRPVYDPDLFSWVSELEARWPQIREELLAILQRRATDWRSSSSTAPSCAATASSAPAR